MLLGAHMSTEGGVWKALERGAEIGATTIQIFTSNQRQWKGRKFKPDDIARWEEALEETGIKDVMSHSSYLINLGSPRTEMLHKSRSAFREEIERCLALGIRYLNFHPGAALDGTEEECLDRIAESLIEQADLLRGSDLMLLLEATAGQGSHVGHRFEHLASIIEQTERTVSIGVCIDTCHIFAAGYDIRTKQGWEATLREFDERVGLKYLKAFHLNDSLKELGSRRDRHAHLGEGEIGLESFQVIMRHPKLHKLPKYLETPLGPSRWKDEIALLRSLAK